MGVINNVAATAIGEIVPILRALQHLYGDPELRRELLRLVGKDINQDTSRKRGRRGLNYWESTALAAARLGCNLDYDKLQDLAENHRSLRHIMGIGAWQEDVDFDWRRIEDNLIKLRSETLKKITIWWCRLDMRWSPRRSRRCVAMPSSSKRTSTIRRNRG